MKVNIRMHQQRLRFPTTEIRRLQTEFRDHDNVRFDTETRNLDSLLEAHALITDFSGIALEFVFGLSRPVLFLQCDRKIYNPAYKDLCHLAVEVKERRSLGRIVAPSELAGIGSVVTDELNNPRADHKKVQALRERYLYNLGTSGEAGADYLGKLLSQTGYKKTGKEICAV